MPRQAHRSRRDWWHSYADVLAEGFDTYVDLEIQASSIQTFEAQLVPGLLQTESYARAVLSAAWVTTEQGEIDRRAAVRMRRQEMIASKHDGPQLWAVLDEAVLRRPAGGAQPVAPTSCASSLAGSWKRASSPT